MIEPAADFTPLTPLTPLICRISAACDVVARPSATLSHDDIAEIAASASLVNQWHTVAADLLRLRRLRDALAQVARTPEASEYAATATIEQILELETAEGEKFTSARATAAVETAEYLCDYILEHHDDLTDYILPLLAYQRSDTSWELPVAPDTPRGTWCGREHWVGIADALLDQVSASGLLRPIAYREAYLEALCDFASASGQGITASNRLLARRARELGATCSQATAERAIRAIRSALKDAGLAIERARGRYLRSCEIAAAMIHHGGRQRRVASSWDLVMPTEYRPEPDPIPSPCVPCYTPESPTEQTSVSTYSVGKKTSSITKNNSYSNARMRAREEEKISQRSWMIADDLLRRAGTASGPYARLTQPAAGDIRGASVLTRRQAARIIEELVPSGLDAFDVLRHIFASQVRENGYVALGWGSRPRYAARWFRAVITACDFSRIDLPTASRTRAAFGMSWCGLRRDWKCLSTESAAASRPAQHHRVSETVQR